jgi:EAL domain-containing protein (putative c-di-GMP-specific phosphodiesterase class I)
VTITATLDQSCTLVMGTRGHIRVAGGRTDVVLQADPRELAGLDIGDFLSEADRSRLFSALRQVTGSQPLRIQCEMRGRERPVPVELTLEATDPGRSGERWVLRCEPVGAGAGADVEAPVVAPGPAPSEGADALDVSVPAIERALCAGEFDLDYQPIVDLSTGRTVGYESLVRWVRPGVGRVSAGAFLPAVEEAGLMPNLSRLVLERSVSHLVDAGSDGDGTGITVNVAASDLARRGFAVDVGKIVADAGIDPHRLVLEFTEEALRLDPEGFPATLARLRDVAGVQLALDDYGTALSTVSALSLPVDVIKLDRSVTTQARASERGASILARLMDLSRAAGALVIGEGVEKPSELRLLEKVGCDYAQGYLLGRPRPAS